jgi:hypothetical protein
MAGTWGVELRPHFGKCYLAIQSLCAFQKCTPVLFKSTPDCAMILLLHTTGEKLKMKRV